MPLLPFSTGLPIPVPIKFGGTGSSTQNFVDLSSTQSAIGGMKTFTANGTGGSNPVGAITTHDITVVPNSAISPSASVFLTNGSNQTWEFFNNSSGIWGIFDHVNSLRPFSVALASKQDTIALTSSGATFNNHILLGANNTYNIGSTGSYASNLYATTLNLNSTASLSGGTAGDIIATTASGTVDFNNSSKGFLITNTTGDANGGIQTTSAGHAAFMNLYALGNYAAFVGWINNSKIWTAGNFGDATGFNIYTGSGGTTKAAFFDTSGNFNIVDGNKIILGITTGTMLGTSSSQKLAFYGSTPIVQPTTTGTTTGFTAGAGTTVDSAATFTGNTGTTAYTIGDIVNALKNLGLLAA